MRAPETAWQLIRREPGPFLGWSLVIAVGVATTWCGVGFIPLFLGATRLLAHASKMAGFPEPQGAPRLAAGFVAGLMGCAVGACAFAVAWLSREVPGHGLLHFAVGAAVGGVLLTPFVHLPVVLVTGRASRFELTNRERLGRLAIWCAVGAVALTIPFATSISACASWRWSEPWDGIAFAASVALWFVAAPWIVAASAIRVRELDKRDGQARALGDAVRPLLALGGLMAIVLAFSLAMQAARPVFVRDGAPDSISHTSELIYAEHGPQTDDVYISGPRLDAIASVQLEAGRTEIRSGLRDEWMRTYPLRERLDGEYCSIDRRIQGGFALWCGDGDESEHVLLDARGVPQPPPLAERLSLGGLGATMIGGAALLFGLAWLQVFGRARHLRQLERARFVYQGTVDEELVFTSADGAHRLHVPPAGLDATAPVVGAEVPAVLMSPEGLSAVGLRTAEVPCPPGTILLLDGIDEAKIRHLTRARTLGFRLALASFVATVAATLAIIARL